MMAFIQHDSNNIAYCMGEFTHSQFGDHWLPQSDRPDENTQVPLQTNLLSNGADHSSTAQQLLRPFQMNNIGTQPSTSTSHSVHTTATTTTTTSSRRLIQCSCTSFGTLYLTSDHNIFATGLIFNPRVRRQFHDYGRTNPTLRNNVRTVASGSNHACLITLNNQVYTVGDGYFGQLGLVDMNFVASFRRVDCGADAVWNGLQFSQVSCGHTHTLLLTECGQVFGFGSSKNGQLSVEKNKVTTPVLVSNRDEHYRIRFIGAGYNYTVMIDESNTAYLMGTSMVPDVGTPTMSNALLRKIDALENRVKEVSCGYSTLAFTTTDNEIYTVGKDCSSSTLLRDVSSDIGTLQKIDPMSCGIQAKVTRVLYSNFALSCVCVTDRNEIYYCSGKAGDTSFVLLDGCRFSDTSLIEVASGARHLMIYPKEKAKKNSITVFHHNMRSCLKNSHYSDLIIQTLQ